MFYPIMSDSRYQSFMVSRFTLR